MNARPKLPAPKPKLLVILGPTASGKSGLAVALARKFDGEIVSADSRQVYKGLDIGTGKITAAEMRGIPHHLLDVASPRRAFTVAEFKLRAEKAIADISARGKLPILCGGTGLYVQAIVDGLALPDVPPNPRLRAQLEKQSAAELFAKLTKLDPRRAENIDRHNPRRLIRAIEIATAIGAVPAQKKAPPKYDALQIGIRIDPAALAQKIDARLRARMSQGMLAEAVRLHQRGLSWKRMESLGLEYRLLSRCLRGLMTEQEMLAQLALEIRQYAKRQMTWFKRDQRIRWMLLAEKKKVEKLTENFLKK